MPWFDETFFASIVSNVLLGNGMIPEVTASVTNQKEVTLYGPAFFYSAALWSKVFGFKMIKYRFFVFLSGIASLLFTYLCAQKLVKKSSFISKYLFALVLFTDIFWGMALHEGRMDTFAIAFAMAGFYLYLGENKFVVKTIFIGLLFSIALLSTPRSIITLLPIGIYIFIGELKLKNWQILFTILLTVIIAYFCWIFFYFGSIAGFINSFTHFSTDTNQNGVNQYFGVDFFYIPVIVKPLLLIATMLLLLAIIKSKGLIKSHLREFIAFGIGIIFHYCFVTDFGPYGIYIMPLVFMLLYICFTSFYFGNVGIVVLIICNLSYWSLKGVYIFKTLDARNEQTAIDFIKKHIPEGSKIIGDAQYYYIAKANNCKYEYIDKYGSIENRYIAQSKNYDYQYIVISEQEVNRCTYALNYYQSKDQLIEIAKLEYPPITIPFISNFDAKGYACKIYKKVNDK